MAPRAISPQWWRALYLCAKTRKKPQTTVKLLPLCPIKDVFHQPSHHKMWIWWYPSFTPKISRLMPDKRPDIYQSTISVLSCFSSPRSASTRRLTIHHRLWSRLSKCRQERRTSFSKRTSPRSCVRLRVNGNCTQAYASRARRLIPESVSELQPHPSRDKFNPLPGGQLNRWRFQRQLMNFPLWQGVSFRPVGQHFKAPGQLERLYFSPRERWNKKWFILSGRFTDQLAAQNIWGLFSFFFINNTSENCKNVATSARIWWSMRWHGRQVERHLDIQSLFMVLFKFFLCIWILHLEKRKNTI